MLEYGKTTYRSLVAGLVAQLSVDFESTCAPLLKELYELCDYGKQPPFDGNIVELLKKMLMNFQNVYVVIDGIEECEEFGEFMGLLKTMKQWNLKGLHVFLTGNLAPTNYPDLEPLLTHKYGITLEDTNGDILLYIDNRVGKEQALGKWKDKGRLVMREMLVEKANGM